MAALLRASAWAARLYVMYDVQLAAVYVLHWNYRDVHPLETAHVYRPNVRSRSRTPEREDSADWAKVVFRCLCIPFVQREFAQRCKKPQVLLIDTMVQRTPAAAYGAVTDADVIDVGINLELDVSAMATTPVRRFHDV